MPNRKTPLSSKRGKSRANPAHRTARSKDPVGTGGILVPVDFSAGSERALDFALELARGMKTAVTVLHVAELGATEAFSSSTEYPVLEDWLQQTAAERMAHLVGLKRKRGLVIREEIRSGWPFSSGRASEAIVAAATELQSGMIVIATHGRHGWRPALLGSTADRVVRGATCPVLVVPDTASKPARPAPARGRTGRS